MFCHNDDEHRDVAGGAEPNAAAAVRCWWTGDYDDDFDTAAHKYWTAVQNRPSAVVGSPHTPGAIRPRPH